LLIFWYPGGNRGVGCWPGEERGTLRPCGAAGPPTALWKLQTP
jgi:hypothetical protein